VVVNPGGVIPRRTAIVDAAGLTCLWLISVLLIGPAGEFPLNDDWVYAATMRQWFDGGGYHPHDWTAVSFASNALWGALFSLPFGATFTALRVSTLAASIIGVLGVYGLARAQGCSRWLTLTIALTFAFNPLAYVLSYTFMTDTLLATAMIVSALFLARDLRKESTPSLVAGTIAAAAATLSRQPGAAVPLAFFVATLLQNVKDRRRVLRALIPVVVSVAAFFAHNEWLAATGRLPERHDFRTDKLLNILGDITSYGMPIVTNVHFVTLTVGAFLFPVLLPVVASFWSRGRMQKLLVTGSLSLMAVLSVVRYAFGRRVLMPIMRNVLHKSGVGPLTLRDTYILQLPHVPVLPRPFWIVVTGMAVAGAGFVLVSASAVVCRLFQRLRDTGVLPGRDAVSAFLLIASAIYLAPVLIAGLFDRYLIPVLPFVAVGLAGIGSTPAASESAARAVRVVQAVVVAATCVFAVGATHDYMEWNRTRWTALHDLMRTENIGADRIDGGFEFNGLLSYDSAYVEDPARSWWWVRDDAYQVSFGPIDGYEIIKEYPYSNWILPREGRIVVQRRRAATN
jgi:hypothetical protein